MVCVLTFAGCVSPALAPPVGPAEGDAAAAPADGAALNQFLLDAPRPPGAAVSAGAEPMVLVDREGRYTLIGDTSGVYKSVDGSTWTRLRPPVVPGVFTDGWALAQDDDGTLYAANTQGQLIYFSKSTDHGATWSSPASVIDAGVVTDRPWLAARGSGEVSLVIYSFPLGETCARSTDGGRLWLDRTIGSESANAGNLVYDDRGRMYYAVGNQILRFTQSCRAGAGAISLPASGPQIFTQLAVDDASRMYVALPTTDSSKMTIRGYSSWDAASLKTLDVSPPELKSNTYGSISEHGDEIVVAWYGSETAGNPSGSFSGSWNVYVARVTGFWTTTPTVTYSRLTTEANHVGAFCMNGVTCSAGSDRDLLDYFGVDQAPDGTIHVAYGHDGSTSTSQVRYAKIAP